MSKLLTGKVYLTGAGPGDPSLITVKAASILAKADVVITDRLVCDELLTSYVNPEALIIHAGKEGGSNASVSQRGINELLVKCAGLYNTIVRLKGGDVSVFSNILDELEVLTLHGIEYEIIPGISAFSGAAASTGIPLTARGFSTGIRLLTYYQNTAISDEAWKDLAGFRDTLVFYMTGNNLLQAVNNLLQSGAISTTPFVVIEQATTSNQYVHEFTLDSFARLEVQPLFQSPSLVIIGEVTSLYKKFSWMEQSTERTPFFRQLDNVVSKDPVLNNFQKFEHVSRY